MSVTTALTPPDLDPFRIKTYFNNKVQDAIDWGADNGPCTIILPPAYYTKDTSLILHGQVALGGLNHGPFDNEGLDPASGKIGATFAVENTDKPFITQVGNGGCLKDLVFHYPGQVGWNSSQPVSYPPTIQVTGSCSMLKRLFGVNPFVFIDIECGRTTVVDCHSGAIQAGLIVDHSEDYTNIARFLQTTSYNQFPLGAVNGTPTPLDEYTIANRYGIMVHRADSFHAVGCDLWWNYCGYYFGDSPDATLPFSRAGYGQITDWDVDTCQYAIIAASTDPVGGGFTFQNGNVGCYQPLAKCAVITVPGGLQEPMISWQGGAIRGEWPISNQMVGKITTKDIVGHDI